MSEWTSASESVADALWHGDDDDCLDNLSVPPVPPDTQGKSLVSAPRSTASRRLAGAAPQEPPPPPPPRSVDGPSSFYLRGEDGAEPRSRRRDGAAVEADARERGAVEGGEDADLEMIAANLGMTRDEESRMLAAPSGRREWIRKEMLRREREFVTLTRLKVRVGTWNVNGRPPKVALNDWLLPGGVAPAKGADVYLVALQEVQPLSGMSAVTTDPAQGVAWKNAVEEVLDAPNSYVTIAARQMVGILLVIVVKSRHEPFVREVMSADAGTGFMRSGGNKGGVACRFALYDKTISFVSCHFAAHEHNVERRNQDFHECVRRLAFVPERNAPSEPSPFSYLEFDSSTAKKKGRGEESNISKSKSGKSLSTGRDVTTDLSVLLGEKGTSSQPVSILEHDACFWAGDLNYRVDIKPEEVMSFVEKGAWNELKKHDQLHNARMNGEVFQGFEEGELNFAPTYKLKRELNEYEQKEVEGELVVKRTPSWTDRVLWRDRVRSSPLVDVGAKDSSGDEESEETESAGFGCGVLGRLLRSGGGNRAGAVRLIRYHRCELLSSDHRPVNADFSLPFRLINIKKRNEIVRKIHGQLLRREEALRPLLSVSALSVELGRVEYGQVVSNASTPFSLRNDGLVTAFIAIDTHQFPSWLSLDPSTPRTSYALAPGSSSEIVLQVRVAAHKGMSTGLNMRKDQMRAMVRVSVQNRIEFLLPVAGEYVPTALGNTLSELSKCVRPIAEDILLSKAAGGGMGHDSCLSQSPVSEGKPPGSKSKPLRGALPIPKEVWRLVDFILHRVGVSPSDSCVSSSGNDWDPTLFVEEADHESVLQVLSCVDTGAPFPESVSSKAVGTCLLDILRSLEEPVVPVHCMDACVRLGVHRIGSLSRETLLQAISRAPPVNTNTLLYLTAFLSQLPGPSKAKSQCLESEGGSSREKTIADMYESMDDVDGHPSALALASIFASVLFREAPSFSTESSKFGVDGDEQQEELQAKYLCHLMDLPRNGGFSATFDL